MRPLGRTQATRHGDPHATDKSKRPPLSVSDFQALQNGCATSKAARAKARRRPTPLGNELQEVFNQVRALEEDVTRTELAKRYAIGRIIHGVERAARHGQKGVEQLARALGRDKSTLYRASRIFECWPEPEFQKLTTRAGTGGHRITWSHFELLVAVDDDARREELTERVFAGALSVKELKRALRPAPTSEPKEASRPRGQVVRTISAEAAAARDRLERAGRDLGGLLLSPAEEADLADAVDRLTALADAVSDLLERLAVTQVGAGNDAGARAQGTPSASAGFQRESWGRHHRSNSATAGEAPQ